MNLQELRAALAQVKIAVAPVTIPGVGTMFVRALTVAEVEDEEAPAGDKPADRKGRLARSAMRLLCDAEGNRLAFEPEDTDLFRTQPWEVLQKIMSTAREHNGLGNLGNG
jgi:hypothetical protein